MACQAPPPKKKNRVAADATKPAQIVLMMPVERIETMVRRAAAGAFPMWITAMASAMATVIPAGA